MFISKNTQDYVLTKDNIAFSLFVAYSSMLANYPCYNTSDILSYFLT
jgi:hypothetical protein